MASVCALSPPHTYSFSNRFILLPADRLHQLRRWLSPSPVEDDLRAHLTEHRAGSSDWFLTSDEFSAFVDGNTDNLLRVVARPGSGKSTLAAFLIDHLANARQQKVVYFFCDSNHSEKRQSVVVVRSLIAQLLDLDATIESLMQPVFQQSGRAIADSDSAVSQMLSIVLQKQQDEILYVVVDALDECTEDIRNESLLRVLRREIANTSVRLLVTSREAEVSPFEPPTPEVTLDAQLCSSSIRDYVADRVQEFQAIAQTDFANEVVDEITTNADGLWLYARLMTDEICRAPSRECIEMYLKSLPNGLFELYSQILRSNERQMTPEERKFARHLYSWLDISDYMPSFWAEKFDRLPFRMVQLVFRHVNGGSEVFDAATLARKIGSPLLRLQDHDSTQHLQLELDFVHQTAYSFLAKSAELPQDQLPATLHPQRLNKLHRAVMAVWYFTECTDSEGQLAMLQDPDRFGEFLGSDAIGCYFEMAYGFLNAFSLTSLPKGLSDEEKSEVATMSEKLGAFIQSGAILRYFEMSTIINYSGNYAQLRDNVVNALTATQSMHPTRVYIPTFEKLRRLASEFFQAWLAILDKTTPWAVSTPRVYTPRNMSDAEPYPINWITLKMQRLGKRNGETFFGKPKTADGSISFQNSVRNSGFRKQRYGLVVCPACHRVVDGYKFDKHADYACPATAVGHKRARRMQTTWRSPEEMAEVGAYW